MDVRREIPVAAPSSGPPAPEVARLEALRRLAMGAAHALNNAFTAVMSETEFLYEDRKDDPVVAETCQAILGQMERCSRITRGLLRRRYPSQAGQREVDLTRLVRELGNLLGETLGSANELEVAFPDDLLLVGGDAESLELLALTLVHYAADQGPGSSRIRLAAEASGAGSCACISVAVRGSVLPEGLAASLLDPRRAQAAVTRSQLEAVRELTAALGGTLTAALPGPGLFEARVELPRLP